MELLTTHEYRGIYTVLSKEYIETGYAIEGTLTYQSISHRGNNSRSRLKLLGEGTYEFILYELFHIDRKFFQYDLYEYTAFSMPLVNSLVDDSSIRVSPEEFLYEISNIDKNFK